MAFAAVIALSGDTAYAWKPYTHNTTALEAYRDAVDDGKVIILRRTYSVAPELVTALRNWPQFYNAGVIGPDGFPGLTYGQSVIHPGTVVSDAPKTGAWLRHVFRSAVAAQSSSLSTAEKEQILAFAFGFLTHAAGGKHDFLQIHRIIIRGRNVKLSDDDLRVVLWRRDDRSLVVSVTDLAGEITPVAIRVPETHRILVPWQRT